MIDFFNRSKGLPNEDGEDYVSLVEKIFYHPEEVSQGEYTAIYEFLLDPEIRDDPEIIAGVLDEFSGWAQYMREQMQKLGLIDQSKNVGG